MNARNVMEICLGEFNFQSTAAIRCVYEMLTVCDKLSLNDLMGGTGRNVERVHSALQHLKGLGIVSDFDGANGKLYRWTGTTLPEELYPLGGDALVPSGMPVTLRQYALVDDLRDAAIVLFSQNEGFAFHMAYICGALDLNQRSASAVIKGLEAEGLVVQVEVEPGYYQEETAVFYQWITGVI